ncbi:O-antigen ligase family protein [Pseudoduganella chitinolytica]|uniref:O-antigen ligase family protein n=1 Tax=Pseudoduganella chitinolytica TaxID=34070 RepID=A0ABY8BAM0_9BURK|nr:O-antigen ligase family protein [Pseudoduganella chitinolytica]WEF32957.1 O-antigen ligase family protein [Pseudoduganella chitinolytica]
MIAPKAVERTADSPPPRAAHSARELFANGLLFLLPALVLTTRDSMTVIQAIMLVAVLAAGRARWGTVWRLHGQAVRWIGFGFAGYFLVSLLRLIVFEQPWRTLDGPFRLLLALSCIAFVCLYRPRQRWFWLGMCVGSIGAGIVALYEWIAFGVDRVEGFTHHAITFGDLAVAMGVMSLCSLSEWRGSRWSWLPVVALVCGLAASVLSGSRGGWVGLLLVVPPLLHYGSAVHGRRIVYAVLAVLALCVVAYFVPATSIERRTMDAVREVQRWFAVDDATTHVGVRLELWKASWMMISEHPWLGVGRDNFFTALNALHAEGRLQASPALVYSSSHNDLIHTLATGGVLDFSLLMVMYLGPLLFFLRVLAQPGGEGRTAALAGMSLVVCYFGFGQTEVMFWLMMPKIFYGMMVCVLAGMCLTANPTVLKR